MGRDTGWIALYAGIGSGGHVILIPEIPFKLDPILKQIAWRDSFGANFTLIVVAEGARPVGGEAMYIDQVDDGGMRRLGGVAKWLVHQLDGNCNHDVREVVLGHLQRGGSPSASDRVLCTRFGSEAVHLIAQGRTGLHGLTGRDQYQICGDVENCQPAKMCTLQRPIWCKQLAAWVSAWEIKRDDFIY